MGTSINTAISPPIPISRRVINDIEEHQRRVLDSYVEGTNRGTNTSPVQTSNEQEEEVTTSNTGQRARITPAEMQEETLQPESLETEDTGMKQVDPSQSQDSESLQTQNIEENEVPDTQDTSDTQIPDDGTDAQLNSEEVIQISLMIRYPKHHRKTIIILLQTMMNSTHYRGRLFEFYANVTRLFTCISTTLTNRCLFTNPRDGSMVRYVFK